MKRINFPFWGLPVSVAVLALFVPQVKADVVVFELFNDTNALFDFDATTGTFSDASGLTATITAIVAGNTGDLNATASSFGINAENGVVPGNPIDDTELLDEDQGAESFSINFSGPVNATLTEIDIVGFGGADAGTLDIAGVSTAIAAGIATDLSAFTNTELVGNTLTIGFTAGSGGNGFGVETLTFHVTPAVIPEPTSFTLLAFGSALMLAHRRRR